MTSAVHPRGRLARLPSGRVAEVLGIDGDSLEAVILDSGTRVTVHARAVRWVGGDDR